MDRELELASQVQTRLLPHTFPVLEVLDIYLTVKQGKFVGIDYCDFLKLSDNVLLIVLADVSGHGAPAALSMSEVHATIQLPASMHRELVDLIQQLNALLYHSTDSRSFVTFFAAEIKTASRSMTYVNAGHPSPLICSNGKIRPLSQGTLPLGITVSFPQFFHYSEEFSPDSIFVSYTDGILERTNSEGGTIWRRKASRMCANECPSGN